MLYMCLAIYSYIECIVDLFVSLHRFFVIDFYAEFGTHKRFAPSRIVVVVVVAVIAPNRNICYIYAGNTHTANIIAHLVSLARGTLNRGCIARFNRHAHCVLNTFCFGYLLRVHLCYKDVWVGEPGFGGLNI